MSETPERKATLTAGQRMAQQADELAARTVATIAGLRVISQGEDDDGRALLQASAVMLAAISVARAYGARAAALRFGRETFAPMPVSPEKHEQIEAGLATCFDSPDARALTTMVRSETVQAAAQEFATQSVEAIMSPDFQLEDMTEDLEDLPEPDDEDKEFEEWERDRDRDRDRDREHEEWLKEQDRIYDEEEGLEDGKESGKKEPSPLPQSDDPSKVWRFIVTTDAAPCSTCVSRAGRRRLNDSFKGWHPSCGCFLTLTLVAAPKRKATK